MITPFTVKPTHEALARLYSGTEGMTRDDATRHFELHLDAFAAMKPRVLAAYSMNALIDGMIITEAIATEDVDAVKPVETLRHIKEMTDTYPWIGKLVVGTFAETPDMHTLEWQIGNHVFDDYPLPFGISKDEGHVLRGFMEGNTDEFRAIASDLFPSINRGVAS